MEYSEGSGEPRLYGHRAHLRRVALAYRRAGLDAVEVDVRVSGGRLVALHGRPPTEKPSRAEKVLGLIDYVLFYGDPLLKPRSLGEWLEELWSMGFKRVLLDLKSYVDPDMLLDVVEKSWHGTLEFTGENHRLLAEIAGRCGRARVYPTLTIIPADPQAVLKPVKAVGASLRVDLALQSEVVEALKKAGFEVMVWTVNDRSIYLKLKEMGVDSVVTDRPEILKGNSLKWGRRAKKTVMAVYR
ncbi:MAG: glycerophosphodiester phosphodiesterase [Desulfurococcales archaeon]|nr:glycerophosphodiester phosphodiesterase [Desulfurococcales archaeon]